MGVVAFFDLSLILERLHVWLFLQDDEGGFELLSLSFCRGSVCMHRRYEAKPRYEIWPSEEKERKMLPKKPVSLPKDEAQKGE